MLVRQKTGAGETAASIAAVSFSDPGAVDMDIPGVDAASYSVQTWIRLYQESESLTFNLKCYSSGSMPSGVKVWIKTETTYTTPAVPTDVSDMVELTTYTAGSPLSLDSETGYTTQNADVGLYAVLVCQLDRGLSAGLKVGEDIIFSWESA